MLEQVKNRFPGISCAYLDASGNMVTEYFGVSDREQNCLVDENTVFPACSMSKFVTALCLMKLHEEAVIDIHRPVNQYLRTWKLLTLEARHSEATIRSLMCHTAGIVDAEDGFYGLRRNDPPISLMDILEGRTFYHNRPVRTAKPQETEFAYSDAGYCVLQLLVQEVTNQPFADAAKEIVFDRLGLENTFYASMNHLADYEKTKTMAMGYDGKNLPIPGRFPPCPDLAGAGLWSTPKEMLTIARSFVMALRGTAGFLQEQSAREMVKPNGKFPWAGLGIFINREDVLMSQGWGEHGQCMMKMNCRTGQISVVMTNRNPEMDQSESGVEWLVERNLLSVCAVT